MEYEAIRRLARGGMGVVDLARGPGGELVALKRLGLHGTAQDMQLARSRFEREVETLRRIDHEAVVPLLDVVDDSGDVVLVMPYYEGGSLADLVKEHGPLSARRVRAIADRLLPALAAAHRLGIVHRDIKPANVLFDAAGKAYLADFGVATSGDATEGLTRTGTVLGTPGFLAPEQARGEATTAASDIASLGATLHFAATGTGPYGSGEPAAVLLRTARGRPSVDRAIEPGLRKMVVAMLDPRPQRRPSAAALAGGAVDTDPIPVLRRSRPWLAAAGAAAALLGGVVLGETVLDDGTGADRAAGGEPVPTTEPCEDLPYRQCGGLDAPGTDGHRCIDDRDDYDGDPYNGCEAVPDDVEGEELVDEIEANIVPTDDIDRFPISVDDRPDLTCSSIFRVELVAPEGLTLRLELFDEDGGLVGEATSADEVPGSVRVVDPRCFLDDGGEYEAIVTPVGTDRTAEPYLLTRHGAF